MKNFIKLKAMFRIAGIIALLTVIGFSMIACDNGGGGKKTTPPPTPQTVTYSGKAGELTYTLKITEDSENRAAMEGDHYELTVDSKKSTGTVTSNDDDVLTLQPSETEATPFKVTVTENGGITAMEGTITWDGGTTDDAPKTLTSVISTEFDGTWICTYTEMGTTYTDKIVASNGNWVYSYSEKGESEDWAKGTYSVSGNTVTLTATHFFNTMEQPNDWYEVSSLPDEYQKNYITKPGTISGKKITLFEMDFTKQ